MKPTILRNLTQCRSLLCLLAVLSFPSAVFKIAAFTYTDFSSTNGLNLVGDATQVGTVIRLTPAARDRKGATWCAQKQFCANGFTTSFRFRITGLGGSPGIESGGDGICFSVQNGSPGAQGTEYGAETNLLPANCLGVSLNTFYNAGLEPSGNFVGIATNGMHWLLQRNLNGTPINLSDGNEHVVQIVCNGHFMEVIIDSQAVITNFPVPLTQGLDPNGYGWVGFGARTGGAWEVQDIMSWSFLASMSNSAPVAQCADVIVAAGRNCQADASVNNGSYDPDGDPITISQVPPGPYPLGTNRVMLIVKDDKGASNSCGALVIVPNSPPTLNYTDFSSTNGLSLVGASTVVDGALRLTPATEGMVGTAWALAKQPCASGFDTRFQLRFSDQGSFPGTPLGGDGIAFTLQKIGPTDATCHVNTGPADGSVSVFFNTFWNWPDSTDFTIWDVSGNSVGVVSNGLYLAQTDLNSRGVNLKDGAVHDARIAFDGTGLMVWLDGVMVLTNVPVPGMASAVDADGKAWVGFGAGTGWAWENHDILNWSFLGSSCNGAPVAQCADVIVPAGANCMADASVNNGSFDPDGDSIIISQVPPGPYPLGTNLVTLTVADDKGAANSCSARVIVQDRTPPGIICAGSKVVECGTAWSFEPPLAFDDCSATNVFIGVVSTVTNAGCGGTFTATRTWQAVDGATNTATCSQTVTVLDTTPPIIVCPASTTVEFQDENGAVVPFVVTASDGCSSVRLVVTPASGSRFPMGVTPVRATAMDSCNNTSQCAFTVTVLGAQGVKSNVLAELIALRSSATFTEPFAQKFDDAIQHLADSLNPAYWVNQTHLQPKGGNTAMNEEKLAASKLREIMDSKGCPVDPAVLQGFIDRIVKCDRLLAIISIQDAASAGLNPKKVAEDFAMVAKGDEEAAKGHYANAIEHYRNAWRHALQLQLQVRLNPDGTTCVQFVGNSSKSYLIEVSADMVNWVLLETCTASGDEDVEFTDPNAGSQAVRFYRVVEQ